VYCGQKAAWVKVPLGKAVGIGPGDIVLDGDPATPTESGTAGRPLFGPYLLWQNGRLFQQLLSSCVISELPDRLDQPGIVAYKHLESVLLTAYTEEHFSEEASRLSAIYGDELNVDYLSVQ